MKNETGHNITYKKSSWRKYTLAAVALLLLIFSALVFILVTGKSKPDSTSEKIIREIAAEKLNKNPNELTDNDFAKITELSFTKILDSNELAKPIVYRTENLIDIKLLEKFINLQKLSIFVIAYDRKNVPRWMLLLNKFGIYDINKRFAVDLKPLEKLSNLQELQIGGSRIKSLKPLSTLTNLRHFQLSYLPTSNLEPISGLSKLLTLHIYDTDISNLENIKNLTNLQELIIHNSSFWSIEPIKSLKHLQILRLYFCRNITDNQIEDLRKSIPVCSINDPNDRTILFRTIP